MIEATQVEAAHKLLTQLRADGLTVNDLRTVEMMELKTEQLGMLLVDMMGKVLMSLMVLGIILEFQIILN